MNPECDRDAGGSSSRFSTNESPLSSRTGVAPASHAPAHHVTVRQCGVIPRCTRAPGPASAVRKPAHLACHMLRTCPVSSMRSSGEYHVSHGREESAAEGRTRASASFMRRFKQKTGVVKAAAPRSRAAVPQGVGRGRRWGRRVSRGGGRVACVGSLSGPRRGCAGAVSSSVGRQSRGSSRGV